MNSDGRLHGQVALITGAGSNIGRAIALRFAGEGARVAAVDRNRASGEETVQAVQALGGTSIFVQADVTEEPAVRDAIEATVEAFGRVDILVNCAGLWHYGSVVETDEQDWDRVFAVNVKAPFLFAKHALSQMENQRSGTIVNISAAGGLAAVANQSAYNASKAAVISLTRNLAIECAPWGIRVNCICPGPVEVGMKTVLHPDAFTPGPKPIPPLGQLGSAKDIANAALFLASTESSYVTGHILVADGGLFLGQR